MYKNRKPGFTLIELLIGISIIGVLAGIVIVAINPAKQFTDTRDAERYVMIREQQNAIVQYQIDQGQDPVTGVPNGETYAKKICRAGVTDASCVNLDALVTSDFLVALAVDPLETDVLVTGYRVYKDNGSRSTICSDYVSDTSDTRRCSGSSAISNSSASSALSTASSTSSTNEGGAGGGGNQACNIQVGIGAETSILVGTKLYVTNSFTDNVSVINTVTNTLLTTIAVGEQPGPMVVDGDKLYVINVNSGSVSVINTNTNAVMTTITVGTSPLAAIYANDTVYVLNLGSNNISMIDTLTDTMLGNISTGFDPFSAAYTNNTLFVANRASNSVYAIGQDGVVSIPAVQAPITTFLVGTKLYVLNFNRNETDHGNITVIDTIAKSVLYNINVVPFPNTITRVGTKLYIGSSMGGDISIVDSETDTVLKTMYIGGNSYHATAIGTKVYYSIGGTLQIVDTTTDTLGQTITLAGGAGQATVVGTKLYVIQLGANSVAIVDTVTNTLLPCGG